jgi:hypothetical protein
MIGKRRQSNRHTAIKQVCHRGNNTDETIREFPALKPMPPEKHSLGARSCLSDVCFKVPLPFLLLLLRPSKLAPFLHQTNLNHLRL